MCPGFDSQTRRHMWVEFVVGSLLCSERFFSGYSGFPFSSKTNISKFQFDPECTDISERVLVNSLVLRVGKQMTLLYIFYFLTCSELVCLFFSDNNESTSVASTEDIDKAPMPPESSLFIFSPTNM